MRRLFWLLALLLSACSAPDRPSISLYLAVQRGDLDQIERHIHWGSDINQLGPDGQRPLHVAASMGRVAITQLLIRTGTDIEAVNLRGRTPLQEAVLAGRIQVAGVLRKAGATLDADAMLLAAAAEGTTDRDIVNYLVQQGANLEVRDANGDTALLLAIRQGNHRLVRHLVSAGADVNAENAGDNALAIAQRLGFGDIAQLLQRQGAVATAGQ